MVTRIDIGVFAHNEASNIGALIDTLGRQNLLHDPDFHVRLHILANGCSDATCALAHAALARLDVGADGQVHDLQLGGKSRTWNRFVHDFSRDDADLLVFCDADIALPDQGTVRGLINLLQTDPIRHATVSRAIKDIAYRPDASLGPFDRLIAGAAGTLDDWQHSICGQLYTMRSRVARGFYLPVGLPVEDGFARAMILTSGLSEGEVLHRIWGEPQFFHVYASERSVVALIRHQVRIVIGSAINTVLFDVLTRDTERPATDILREVRDDPEWLVRTLQSELPRSYGYVPWGFATKRLRRFGLRNEFKHNIILLLGFGFDCLVYVNAQWRMFRGVGAGFW